MLAALVLSFYARGAKAQEGGVTHVDTVPAPSLRKNLVGDPDRRAMTIYLPPSYSKFGRVIEGQDVVNAIAGVARNQNDKPLEPVVSHGPARASGSGPG